MPSQFARQLATEDFRRETVARVPANPEAARLDPIREAFDSVVALGLRTVHLPGLRLRPGDPEAESLLDAVLAEARTRGVRVVADCALGPFDEDDRGQQRRVKEVVGGWAARGLDGLRFGGMGWIPLWYWQELATDLRRVSPQMLLFGEQGEEGALDERAFEHTSGMTLADRGMRAALEEALARDGWRGFGVMGELFQRDGDWRTASSMVTFVDAPGLARFRSLRDDPVCHRMATLLALTARGIPCIEASGQSEEPGGLRADDVRALALLRQRNLAVQKGGMFMHVVAPDLLVFSRRYMGASMVVAMNKGGASEVHAADLPLANGTRECLLTGRAIEVSDGWATLSLEPGEVLVFERPTPAGNGRLHVEFQLNGLHTRFGEDVFLTGDCPELGEWDTSSPVRMEYVNGNTWCADVSFSPSCGESIAWKYLIRSAHGIVREPILPRVGTLPEAGAIRIRDDWARS